MGRRSMREKAKKSTPKIRRMYKYRLYHTGRRNRRLHEQIDIAGLIWNHGVALQRRCYRLTGKYIPASKLKSHLAHLRREIPAFAYWQLLNSQTVQDIVERLDNAYQRFFAGKGGLPNFKKIKKYRSITLKQAGWKLLGGNKIRIGKRIYKFVNHRELRGEIKTVTIKRDTLGRLWLCFSVVEKLLPPAEASAGKIGGFDFGLKTFLTDDEGGPHWSPQFFARSLRTIAKCNRALSRKQKGSRNRKRAQRALDRAHDRVANQRRNDHFRLAHELCDQYDVMILEDLNLAGMKRLWGRKVSDLGFGQFTQILGYVAAKRGKRVEYIDRFTPTSQTCSQCGHRQVMPLRERTFHCEECGFVIDRDHNAARNILRVGMSTLDLEVVRPSAEGSLA